MSASVFPVPAEVAARAHVDNAKYLEMYQQSVSDPDGFWGEHGKRVDWIKPFTKVKNTSYDYHNVSIKWFEDGTLNVSANCIDRHLATRGDSRRSSGKATIRLKARSSPTRSCITR
jgi:acetyl-CoA synthetase